MKIIHDGIEYECAVAVKCTDDNYIKLYDSTGKEIAAFYNISDFDEYTITGGTFTDPGKCSLPIPVSCYVIGDRTISAEDWTTGEDGKLHYEIQNDLISANKATCNVLLLFASGTKLTYTASQQSGKIVLSTDAAPLADVVIESIQITRV